jgi:hypothetical protein
LAKKWRTTEIDSRSTHAEISWILEHGVPDHMWVVRFRKGTLLHSKPCALCVRVLKDLGVVWVTYSTKDASAPLKTEKVDEMDEGELSQGERNRRK